MSIISLFPQHPNPVKRVPGERQGLGKKQELLTIDLFLQPSLSIFKTIDLKSLSNKDKICASSGTSVHLYCA